MINLDSKKSDENWSFSDIKRSETLYATHGYHRYHAKFIPQLVQKLMAKYSKPGDIILDCFGGCGTTLVEARISGRASIGLDVNKVAVLISKAKTMRINPEQLRALNKLLLERIAGKVDNTDYFSTANERLKYWFKPVQFNKLKIIYDCIQDEQNSRIRLFYNCCFSNILKNCSIWYSRSVKPMRDFSKKLEKPLESFAKHLEYMTKKNEEFVRLLESRKVEDVSCVMKKGDARKMYIPDEHVDLIITSPPYVTSYEYADLHQLSILWFGYADDIKKIRKDFVGTSSRKIMRSTDSKMVNELLEKLVTHDHMLARHVSNYYFDLSKCYSEMYRVLKPNKYLCIIIGDTEYGGIKIPNAEITIEFLRNTGFKIKRIIKRRLSSKIFTPYRDKSGRFADSTHGGKRKIYQHEFIIISQKPNVCGHPATHRLASDTGLDISNG